MIIKNSKPLLILIIVVFILILLNLIKCHIPASAIYPILKEPERIKYIYLEIQTGGDYNKIFDIDRKIEIDTITNFLAEATLSYKGAYSMIQFSGEKEDFLITLHLRGEDNIIHIKQNGIIYDKKSCFVDKTGSIIDLYNYILQNYMQ